MSYRASEIDLILKRYGDVLFYKPVTTVADAKTVFVQVDDILVKMMAEYGEARAALDDPVTDFKALGGQYEPDWSSLNSVLDAINARLSCIRTLASDLHDVQEQLREVGFSVDNRIKRSMDLYGIPYRDHKETL